MRNVLYVLLSNFIFLQVNLAQGDFLKLCLNKLAKPLEEGKYLQLSYSEKRNELYHGAEPWIQLNYEDHGTVWLNNGAFIKQDTLNRDKEVFFSKTQYNESELLFIDHGDKDLMPVTKNMFAERHLLSARYSPVQIIELASQQNFRVNKRPNPNFAVYEGSINTTQIKIYIRKADSLPVRIHVQRDDELYGDVWEVFYYLDYSKTNGLLYPQTISISKNNGKVKDDVKIVNAVLTDKAQSLLEKPAGYTIKEEEPEKPEINIEKYNEHVHFINLMHASSRILLVEFKDFLLVAEAPLNSKNGELIIQEAKKIAPGKPIKYFVFGHHHAHYLGGMRAFVHKGVTVLALERNKDYLYYLVNSPHALNPDSLHLQPKQLHLQIIKDSLTVTDGKYAMKIYFMGEKSGHTKDYLVYYFPEEKMLFEDDLIWIRTKGEPRKASSRQAGMYNLIKEKNLNVKTVIQSWGIASEEYKTIIPFQELEASMNVK